MITTCNQIFFYLPKFIINPFLMSVEEMTPSRFKSNARNASATVLPFSSNLLKSCFFKRMDLRYLCVWGGERIKERGKKEKKKEEKEKEKYKNDKENNSISNYERLDKRQRDT